MISIILPSFHEPYLNQTLASLVNNSTDTEIIPVLDGYKPTFLLRDDRIKPVFIDKRSGMRSAFNAGLRKANGKFIMKLDAHCCFDKDFDKVLLEDMKENWLVIPRRYPLNADKWDKSMRNVIKDYHYYAYPNEKTHFGMPCPDWPEMVKEKRDVLIDDTMAFQGSCWFAKKDFFMSRVGYLDFLRYTPYSAEQLEVGLNYWLKDGEVKVNKKTWYAHLFKNPVYYKKWGVGRREKMSHLTWKGHKWAANHWLKSKEKGLKHKFEWLLEKFWPVPGWPENYLNGKTD